MKNYKRRKNYYNATKEEQKLMDDLENGLLKTDTEEEQEIYNKALMLKTKNPINGGWAFWFQGRKPEPPLYKMNINFKEQK